MQRQRALLIVLLLFTGLSTWAQDRALEQRMNELAGRMESLIEGQESLRKQISEVVRELNRLREQQNKPLPASASQDDLKRLADAVRDIDRKRLEDYDKIRSELLKLGKTISASAAVTAKTGSSPARDSKADIPDKGYKYVIQSGDTLSAIIEEYRRQNINVTLSQILKANPGLKPERMPAGLEIFIPAPVN